MLAICKRMVKQLVNSRVLAELVGFDFDPTLMPHNFQAMVDEVPLVRENFFVAADDWRPHGEVNGWFCLFHVVFLS
jgi:hypothetical protein